MIKCKPVVHEMQTEPNRQLTYDQMCDLGPIIHDLINLVKGKKRAEADSGKRFIEVVRRKRLPATCYEIAYIGFTQYDKDVQKELIEWADTHRDNLSSSDAQNAFEAIIDCATRCSERRNVNRLPLSSQALKQYRGPLGEYLTKTDTISGVAALPELDITALKVAEERRQATYTGTPKEQFKRKKVSADPFGSREAHKKERGWNRFNGR